MGWKIHCVVGFVVILFTQSLAAETFPDSLPGSQKIATQGEIDRQMIAGVSRFLDAQLEASSAARTKATEFNDPEHWSVNRGKLRARLRHILGIRDVRPDAPQFAVISETTTREPVATAEDFEVFSVRWRAFGRVDGEGLLLVPRRRVVGHVILLPDADQTPEQLVGLSPGDEGDARCAVTLAQHGCQVLIPSLVSRERDQFAWHGRRADVTNREFLYRAAFELGRHIIGYEVQKVLAAADWFQEQDAQVPLAVLGWGEGGALALFSGALDDRIQLTCVSGYFEERERVWQQPVDRNVFGILGEHGDAELAALIAGRKLVIEASAFPQVELSGGNGAPGKLATPPRAQVEREYSRALRIAERLKLSTSDWKLVSANDQGTGGAYCVETLQCVLRGFDQSLASEEEFSIPKLTDTRTGFLPNERLRRQMEQIDDHSQAVLRDSRFVRDEFMKSLATTDLTEFRRKQHEYRRRFATEVIGEFDTPRLPPRPRTRKVIEREKWVGYEVVLDVFPDVIAYGLLLLPRDLKPDEKRPVVVCQHGLEGRPWDVIGEESFHYYKAFAAQLADRGFITFAPQNLYRHRDEFRVLQRKANPLGKTLFSIITPQHQQILDWLKTQPNVDPNRIGFYGLSYGGKTAMRVPALLTDYCLSICSADFNEWVGKNASTHNPRSYVWTGEYEIFEFDLGSTFNYAEMAALIAPRPFMVERGHDDGVADDETVAYEFAKVRRRFVKLGIGDRCEIEWFDGPHTIHGKGTFDFLHRHLDWPQR